MTENYSERTKRELEIFEKTGKRPLWWHICMIPIWILWLNCFSAYDFTCKPIIYYLFGKEVEANVIDRGTITRENIAPGIPGKLHRGSMSSSLIIYKDAVISFPVKDKLFQSKLDLYERDVNSSDQLMIQYLRFSPSSVLVVKSLFPFWLFCFFALLNIPVIIIMYKYILFCLVKIIEKCRA